jgi:hypothetical protein
LYELKVSEFMARAKRLAELRQDPGAVAEVCKIYMEILDEYIEKLQDIRAE